MMIGGSGSARICSSMCSMICGTVTFTIGVGSALSDSTSTSKPG